MSAAWGGVLFLNSDRAQGCPVGLVSLQYIFCFLPFGFVPLKFSTRGVMGFPLFAFSFLVSLVMIVLVCREGFLESYAELSRDAARRALSGSR